MLHFFLNSQKFSRDFCQKTLKQLPQNPQISRRVSPKLRFRHTRSPRTAADFLGFLFLLFFDFWLILLITLTNLEYILNIYVDNFVYIIDI